ncbi:MAG: NUDIX domain-containing protein [Pseudomonadota bacterium]
MTKKSNIGVEVEAKQRLALDEVRFHKIDIAEARLRRGGQPWSPPKRWEIVERGDSVALLLHVVDGGPDRTGSVVLTRQFRAPLLNRPDRARSDYEEGALMLEAIAGMVGADDPSARHALARETLEEVGYELDPSPPEEAGDAPQIEEITSYFPSPGGCSEQIAVFYAAVSSGAKTGPGGGNAAAGEMIETVEIPVDAFFDMVERGEIHDSKILVGYARFRDRVIQARSSAAGGASFRLEGVDPPVRLHLRIGDIRKIKDVDVWVNSENTLMEMDQFVGASISAAIRAGGAWIDPASNMVRADYVADALRRQMERLGAVGVGDVVETTPGRLALTNRVRRLFHIATVVGEIGRPVRANDRDVSVCVTRALSRICAANRSRPLLWAAPYTSAVLPLIGAGNGGLSAVASMEGLVEGLREFLAARPRTRLRDVHLSIFKNEDFAQAYDFLTRPGAGFALEGR